MGSVGAYFFNRSLASCFGVVPRLRHIAAAVRSVMADSNKVSVKVLLTQRGEWWVAQCLEYDIATQARSLPSLQKEIERVLAAHVAISADLGREPFAGLKPAPQKYWDMFSSSEMRVESVHPATDGHTEVFPQMRVAAT